MATVRITGVQMKVASSKAANLPRVLGHIEQSRGDFVVFPELCLTGSNGEFSDARNLEAWRKIGAACRQSYITAIVGTGARTDGDTFNQVRIYSGEGELLGTQEKLVPVESERKVFRPGPELRTFEHNGITFGCLIGNDLWVAPGCGPYADTRLSYQLGQQGVQVIFHCVASGTDPQYREYFDSNLRLRAKEAKCPIVVVNAASDTALNVPSGIVSAEGEWLVKCPLTGEQQFSHDLVIETD
jgi:predicted amidohydrolase